MACMALNPRAMLRRSPQGERGLKYETLDAIIDRLRSLSARRAWIEIARPERSTLWTWSLSARRAWIEIPTNTPDCCVLTVALRKESVD